MVDTAANFGGSMPLYYDSIMGPAQFEPYGRDLAARLPPDLSGDVLEIACGTGRVTRHLRKNMSQDRTLVASDISAAMLDYAKKQLGSLPGIEWREADASKLPFPDARFVAVVCAFGVMFMPDKAAALREARRVLVKGGTLLFNVWDGLENNPHGRCTSELMESLLPGDPVMKGGSVPYLFNDRAVIAGLLKSAGFQPEKFQEVKIPCECPSARDFANGQIRGTPRGALLAQKGIDVDAIVDKVAEGLAKVGGAKPFRYTPQALVVEARAA
ncbi:MAG TPA: methyltransferase domain-containing protein [Burkholderiales bacterium]|nr:methyltransferase domain-containing protein [Burkholderiales bacterium]